MKKQVTSWLLVLVLCLGLTVPAAAAEEKVTVGDKTYETVLDAILSEKEDKPITVALSGDVALTAAVVLGESKVDDKTVTVASHDVTVDLNGCTLTGAKDSAVFEVQEGYTLTIVDNSEAKTGKLVSQGKVDVDVKEGATYNALPTGEEETPAEKPVNPFKDVAEASPYYSGILWAVENGITNGTTATTFAPGNTCSRANIITFLWRAAGSPEPTVAEHQYEDVTNVDAYYYKAVQWAAEKDMWAFGTFEPNAPCDRLTAVYFMWCAAGSPEMEGELPFTDVSFGDGDENGQPIYAEADDAVLWAVAQGITNGTTATTFSSEATCTRGQIATFLYRAAQAEQAETPAE